MGTVRDAVIVAAGLGTRMLPTSAYVPKELLPLGDYKAEDIVGYDHVIENGGQVVTIPLLEGHSTTAILND